LSESAHVAHASTENFNELVLGNSRRGLVLVYYWTPSAGPCLRLMPRLVDLARAYEGRFLLVLANTDEVGRLAREQGVTSVPTVKFYLHGEVAHSIHGAEPDSTFRAALGRFLGDTSDHQRLAALAAHQAGRTGEAIELLARAAVDRPDDLAISVDLAKLLLLDEQPERALALLAALPAEARRDGRVAPLLAHLELIEAARQDTDDTEALRAMEAGAPDAILSIAARALFEDRLPEAMDTLLRLALEHPGWREDIGRRAMLALFDMLGAEHELTRAYRARLARAAS
jgi:putative thioredoxin